MRAALFILIAVIFFMAGLGATVTCTRALKDDDIMSTGRRHSRLIERETEPGLFWFHISVNALLALALFGGSGVLVVSAIRGPKKSSSPLSNKR